MGQLIKIYSQAWKSMVHNWRTIMYVYLIGLLILFLGFGPISNFIDQTLGRSLQLDDFISRFDYNSIIDLINHHKPGVNVSVNAILATIIPYWLWSVFSVGGILSVSSLSSIRSSTLKFWSGGARFFFRLLRLKIYIIILLLLFVTISYFFFSKDGLSPLKLDSEGMLISRFKFIVGVLLVLSFFISIFRELASAHIYRNEHDPFIFSANKSAFSKTFSLYAISLSLINLFALGLGALLYFLLKKIFNGALLPLVIVGQLFFIYRIMYRYVRLASYNYYVSTEDSVV